MKYRIIALALAATLAACTQNEAVHAPKSSEIASNTQKNTPEQHHPVIEDIRQEFAAKLADKAREAMEKTQSGIILTDDTLAAR